MNDILIQSPCGIHGKIGIVSVDFHAQSQTHIGNESAGGPQSDHAQCFTHQFGTCKRRLSLLHKSRDLISHIGNGFHPFNAAQHITGGQDQLTHLQLLHSFRIGSGTIEDHDPFLRASFHGNVIVSRTGSGNCKQVVIGFKIQNIGGTNDDSIRIFNLRGDRVSSFLQNIRSHFGNVIDRFNLCHRIYPHK